MSDLDKAIVEASMNCYAYIRAHKWTEDATQIKTITLDDQDKAVADMELLQMNWQLACQQKYQAEHPQ